MSEQMINGKASVIKLVESLRDSLPTDAIIILLVDNNLVLLERLVTTFDASLDELIWKIRTAALLAEASGIIVVEFWTNPAPWPSVLGGRYMALRKSLMETDVTLLDVVEVQGVRQTGPSTT